MEMRAKPDMTRSGGSSDGAPSLGEFDAYANVYDQAVNDAVAFSGLSVDFFTEVKAEYLRQNIATLGGTQPPSILDVGCGVGNFHPLLQAGVGAIAGIDVSAECLAVAGKRNLGVDYRHYDGVNIPFPAGSFDYAFAVCVYHHVPPPMRPPLTRDVARVLKPGGRFAIFEHNPLNPFTLAVVNRCEFDRDAILLKSRQTEALLADAGFTHISTRFILAAPARFTLARKVDRILSSVPLGAQYYTTGVAPGHA